MLIVRAFAAVAKPALLSGAITASAVGGWFAYNRIVPPGQPSALVRLQGQGERLLVSEFGDTVDTIVAVDPSGVSVRTQIAAIDHAPGWGVFPVLSPDGKAIAYTALPPGAPKPSPDTPAQAAIVDADGGAHVVAEDVDLLVAPVWSPDSRSIVVRKNTPTDDGAGAFDLLLIARDGTPSTITTWRSAAVFPIAFSPDGSKLYFATLNGGGTDLYSVALDGSGETKIAHLSDQVARDWRLSPGGDTLAYSAAESGDTPQVIAKTLDLATGVASDAVAPLAGPPTIGVARGELNPAWKDDRSLTIASVGLDGGGSALALDGGGVASALTTKGDGIDLPLAWSPDGDALVVRAVDGTSPFDATQSHVEIVRADGTRDRISDSADVMVVGWTE